MAARAAWDMFAKWCNASIRPTFNLDVYTVYMNWIPVISETAVLCSYNLPSLVWCNVIHGLTCQPGTATGALDNGSPKMNYQYLQRMLLNSRNLQWRPDTATIKLAASRLHHYIIMFSTLETRSGHNHLCPILLHTRRLDEWWKSMTYRVHSLAWSHDITATWDWVNTTWWRSTNGWKGFVDPNHNQTIIISLDMLRTSILCSA